MGNLVALPLGRPFALKLEAAKHLGALEKLPASWKLHWDRISAGPSPYTQD